MRNYLREVYAALNFLGFRKPRGVYDDGWPASSVPRIEIAGHVFAVSPTPWLGVDSMRTRYRVECMTCACVIHEATTGPCSRIADHLERSSVR